jgi:hypothetical protein
MNKLRSKRKILHVTAGGTVVPLPPGKTPFAVKVNK